MPRRRLPFPAFLTACEPVVAVTVERRVRFNDCDPMGILWHGRHLAYCEEARHELGRRIGFGLERLLELELFAPVVRSQVLHHEPIPAEHLLSIEAALYPTEQVRLYHRYELKLGERLCAEAETEQVLTTASYELLVGMPEALQGILVP